jgi:hypothetical protein
VSEDDAPIVLQAPAPESEAEEIAVPEFSVQEAAPEPVAEVAEAPVASAAAPAWPQAEEPASAPEFAVVEESTAAVPDTDDAPEEIDLSSEWDDALSVEAEEPAAEIPAEVPAPVAEVAAPAPVAAHPGDDPRVNEKIDEIRFYLAHGMPEQAMAGLAKLQTLTTNKAKVDEIRAEVEAAALEAAEAQAASVPEPVFEELTADDVPSFEVVEEAPAAADIPVATAPEPPAIEEMPVVGAVVEPEPAPIPRPQSAPVAQKPAPVAPKAAPLPPPPAPEPQPEAGVLEEFVSDLESSLGDTFLPTTVTQPVEPAPLPAAPARASAAAAAQGAPVLGKFVADIEASLGEDFLKAAPVPEKPAPAAVAASQPVTPRTPAPMVASAAASASPAARSVAPLRPTPPAPVPAPHAPAAAAKASPFAEEASIDLAEMFGELKQDLEADVASADEDPETHYNLGIAFREMGLLDEAIGELQKACQSFDRGRPFPQIMQTYTWLAQCFLEKAVPEAAVRWYERALQVPSIDNETRTALNYELASAYEASGDKPSALKFFMDVYGSNIDYRDVSERIKALKS